PFSELEHILPDAAAHTPPAAIFGAEPAHGWCYLYEKAALARQLGDWDTVLVFGEQAFASNLRAADSIEWLPFLQAYALNGRTERLEQIAAFIPDDLFVRTQICNHLTSFPDMEIDTTQAIQSLFC